MYDVTILYFEPGKFKMIKLVNLHKILTFRILHEHVAYVPIGFDFVKGFL